MKQDVGSIYLRGPHGKELNKTNYAFGLFDETMIPKLQWLLKPFGLRLIVKRNSRKHGDRLMVSIEGSKTAAALGRQGGTARAKRMTAEERSESARRAAQARWAAVPRLEAYKQAVLQRYPKAFCLRLQESKTLDAGRAVYVYQIATPVGNGAYQSLSPMFATPRMAWTMVRKDVRIKGEEGQ